MNKILEIEVLNEELNVAYATISTLQQRVKDLEKKVITEKVDTDARPSNMCDEPVATRHEEEERCLLVGTPTFNVCCPPA